jgi:lactoylglutathione lyase
MKNLFVIYLLLLSFFANAQNPKETGNQKPVPALDHIAYYVKNLNTSVNFYTKYFQLDSIKNPFNIGGVKWFKINPGIQLHLVEGAKDKVAVPEFTHLCFSVKSLDNFIKELQNNGVSYYDSFGKRNGVNHRPDGINQIFIQDPDGYWLEINDVVH